MIDDLDVFGPVTAPADKKRRKNAHLWARDPDDWYVEPPWCSRRLFDLVSFNELGRIPCLSPVRPAAKTVVLDPSCGMGRIVIAARAAGYDAYGNDLKDRGVWSDCFRGTAVDFFSDFYDNAATRGWKPHWIISNPPFKLCAMRPGGPPPPYVVRALSIATMGCALLLPLDWLAGDARSKWLATAGLWKVLVITPRPSMPPGAVIRAGESPGGSTEDFAWFIFRKGHTGPWTGGWCDYRPPPPVAKPLDDEQVHLINAAAALET